MSVFVFRTHEIQLIINNIAGDHIRPVPGRVCSIFILCYTHLTRSGSAIRDIHLLLTSKRSHVYRETMKNPTPKVVESESGLRGIRLFYIYLTRSGSVIRDIHLFLTSMRSHVYRETMITKTPTPKAVESSESGMCWICLFYTHSTHSGSWLCGIRFALYTFDPFRVRYARDSSVLYAFDPFWVGQAWNHL